MTIPIASDVQQASVVSVGGPRCGMMMVQHVHLTLEFDGNGNNQQLFVRPGRGSDFPCMPQLLTAGAVFPLVVRLVKIACDGLDI
mmetsp:Transcript_2045/g.7932  ORF Transcript_2045/g.7932 Transcript_2045/m.7932 type:complete len:85 (-) Transcript_2045:33-287(-)